MMETLQKSRQRKGYFETQRESMGRIIEKVATIPVFPENPLEEVRREIETAVDDISSDSVKLGDE